MAKSANDNMIDFSYWGVLIPLHLACVLSWSADGSPEWGPEAKPRLGVWTEDEVPRSSSVLINFKQTMSFKLGFVVCSLN